MGVQQGEMENESKLSLQDVPKLDWGWLHNSESTGKPLNVHLKWMSFMIYKIYIIKAIKRKKIKENTNSLKDLKVASTSKRLAHLLRN